MSVNLKYQHVAHFALLPVFGVHEVVCAALPPAAQHLPAVVAPQLAFLGQGHDPHQLMCALALIEEQLGFLQVDSTFYLLSHVS